MSAQHHCDWCMLLNSIYMLVKVLSYIITLQRCLNDIIMFWEQKGARLWGMSHTHRHCDSAYCCADLSHQRDVCCLKQTCTPTGALWKYLTTVTDVMILTYTVGLDVARMGPSEVKIAFIIAQERNNVVVLFGTLKVQSSILTEVSDVVCWLLSHLLLFSKENTCQKKKAVSLRSHPAS